MYNTDTCKYFNDINGLVQDCIISSVLAMETLQSCTKLSIYQSFSHCDHDYDQTQTCPAKILILANLKNECCSELICVNCSICQEMPGFYCRI